MPDGHYQPPTSLAVKHFLSKIPSLRAKYAEYNRIYMRPRGTDKRKRKRRAKSSYAGGRRAYYGEAREHYSTRLTPTAKAIAREEGGDYIEKLIRADKPERFPKEP